MLPSLPISTETRDGLHAYCRVLGALRAQAAKPHPRWWHISLQVDSSGFTTGPIRLHPGREFELRLGGHQIEAKLLVDGVTHSTSSLAEGASPAALGAAWASEIEQLGLGSVEIDSTWSQDVPPLHPREVAAWLSAFQGVAATFEEVRDRLAGERGPVQLWPHHFDLSFEWFGRELSPEQRTGEVGSSQIGFGFSPGDEGHPAPYFYANPWPFSDALVESELPSPATWHREGWQGSLLPYDSVLEDQAVLSRYLETVYSLASPGLA